MHSFLTPSIETLINTRSFLFTPLKNGLKIQCKGIGRLLNPKGKILKNQFVYYFPILL